MMLRALAFGAVLTAFSTHAYCDQQQAIDRFQQLGGRIETDGEGRVVLLHLEGTSVTDRDLLRLNELPDLRRLYLADTRITDNGIRSIRQLTGLQRLSLWDTALTDRGLATLSDLETVEVFDLHNTNVSDQGLSVLRNWKRLAYLNVSHNRLDGSCLQVLKRLPRLKYLDLSHNQINDLHVADLAALHSRVRVSLVDNSFRLSSLARGIASRTRILTFADRADPKWAHPNAPQLQLGPVAAFELDHIRHFDRLLFLRFDGCAISGEQLSKIGKVRQLQELRLVNCTIGGSLQSISELSSLGRLVLNGTRVADGDLAAIAALPLLQTLEIEGDNLTGDGIEHLANAQFLRDLNLSGQPLSAQAVDQLAQIQRRICLNLQRTSINDERLATICENRRITRLHLDGCQITDASVDSLKQLNQLQSLSITETDVSPAGALQLVADLPKLSQLRCDFGDLSIRRSFENDVLVQADLEIELKKPWLAGADKIADVTFASLKIENMDNKSVPQLNHLRKIKSMHLAGKKLNDRGLEQIDMPASVRRLMMQCPNVTDKSLATMRQWKSLRVLSLPTTRVSDAAVALVPELGLQNFSTDRCRVRVEWSPTVRLDVNVAHPDKKAFLGLRYLATIADPVQLKYWDHARIRPSSLGAEMGDILKFKKLQSLSLASLQLSASDLDQLSQLKQLQTLKLGSLDGQQFRQLAAMTWLTSLHVSIISDAADCLAPLASLTSLRELQLGGDPAHADGAPLTRLKELETLSLGGIVETDHLMPAIGKLTQLKHLQVRQISDDRMVDVGRLRQLRSFDASYGDLTDNGLQPLEQLRQLEELSVHGTFTGRGLRHLARLNNLKSLTVSGLTDSQAIQHLGCLPSLERLTISGQLEAEGYRQLAKLTKLRELYLYVNDDALDNLIHLASLPNLKVISLWEASPTQEVIDRLPGVTFQYDGQ